MQGKGPLNRAAFAIHAALHEDRPDIVAAAHTHSTYGKAWSTFGKALGPHKAVILKNHGILTAGPSVQSTAWWYIALENACQVQLLAHAAGTPDPIDHDMASLTHAQIGRPGGAEFAFKAWFDQLVEREPDVLK